jgi:hypothetical protein
MRGTHMFVLLSVAVLAVVAGAVWWLLGRAARPGAEETGRLVLRAFGRDWAKRFGRAEDELSAAFFAGADAELARRVEAEVGVVDLRFDGRNPSADVSVAIVVRYAGDDRRSTAYLTLPWDDVPRSVRAGLLGGDPGVVFRKWRAAA